MGSFSRSFYSDTPVLAIPSQPAHHPGFDMPTMASQASRAADPASSFARPPTDPPLRMAGRKRSRDEASPNLNEESPEPTRSDPVAEPDEQWEYGEGMVLIRRGQGATGAYITDASNQSGTWVEEEANAEILHRAASARVAALERPVFRSNKSQRLDPTSSQTDTTGLCAHPASTPSVASVGNSAMCPLEPVVDAFTVHLGIGWRKLSDDEHIQAAARGWARYIENHYPLSSVNIRLQSNGLQAYLVEAKEGFFLFAEDLKQGRLVSTEAEKALHNLKSSPPVFDAHESLFAVETPGSMQTIGAPGFVAPARVDTDTQMS
ncbi:hypothetical protein B0T11DRAFT_146466 [Plectosphaerella cucumerina]|uniref:Uncharacterized protein n=1 Tax=Plectosphaerella cucumerina TaxID=40658 RepID=A0A8K0WYA3_9PEZI|nr:hypothetical protein B0T11DRAFT_146466 [Plectosphaerella cucumerina]